jgi:hypothetical protein
LQQVQWLVSADNFVEPKKTEAFKELIRTICRVEFGVEETEEDQKTGINEDFSVENLKFVTNFADILDREL